MVKLELGCGHRPTPGYVTSDINPFDGVDIVCPAWEVDLGDETVDEVVALGMIEHLTYQQAADTFENVHRMLKPGGVFLCDVPDIVAWCRYAVDYYEGRPVPFGINHIMATLYGWQRWPGDTHASGWTAETIGEALIKAGFVDVEHDLQAFLTRGLSRRRMGRPDDAHVYVQATR